MPAWAGQEEYGVRFQWGPVAAPSLSGGACVVVDVLRFTTAVEAAVSRGVAVYPYRWRDATVAAFADSVRAVLADGRDPAGPSLSPSSMEGLAPGASVVLPSPNGSTCAVLAAEAGAQVVAGCLRNAAAVGAWAGAAGGPVTVIACGERWPDGSLRPSLEDLLGAGAILASMTGDPRPRHGRRSPPSVMRRTRLPEVLSECASGRELLEKGHAADIGYAARLNASATVPVLTDGAFR
jgi:2-phosphosulfolactate phosphatase